MHATAVASSIDTLIITDAESPKLAEKTLANVLNEKLYGSVIPLQFLRRGELRYLPFVGTWSATHIARQMELSGMRLRRDDETLAERAISLYDSIQNVPLYVALLIIEEKNGIDVVMGVRPSNAIKKAVEAAPGATFGMFIPNEAAEKSAVDVLKDFIFEYHLSIKLLQTPDIDRMADELQKRLKYWVDKL